MARFRRLTLWLALALIALPAVAAALWLRDALFEGATSTSPIPPPTHTGASPLPTPASPADALPASRSWGGVGVSLLWAALGCALASGIIILVLRRYRCDVS